MDAAKARQIIDRFSDEKFVRRLLEVSLVLADIYDSDGIVGFLKSSQKILGDRTPLELIETDEGFAEVIATVERIADGAYV